MPIYVYKCDTCQTTTDVRKSVENRDLIEACIVCKNHMKRVITGFAKVYNKGVKGSATIKDERP